MYRFVALAWDPADTGASDEVARIVTEYERQADTRWECPVSLPGLRIVAVPPARGGLRSYVLPNDAGIVFGRLFRRSRTNGTSTVVDEVDDDVARTIVATDGRQLVESFWGSYVAFVIDRTSARTIVVRDCSGKLPCFKSKVGRVCIYFADVADALRVPGLRFSVDWRYLAAFIHFSDLQARASALNEVTEVLAGECVIATPAAEDRHFLWNPSTIAAQPVIDDCEAAMAALRSTTFDCIASWSKVHERILHSLSGGFDSAVVLANLVRTASRPAIVALNRYSNAAGEDERRYARAAALKLGVQLLEREWKDGVRRLDDRAHDLPLSPKPAVATLLEFLDLALLNPLTKRLDVDAVWTGQGGDHIFLHYATSLIVGDYVHHRRLGPHLWEVIGNAARLTSDSYWHVLRHGLFERHKKDWLPDYLTMRQAPFVKSDRLSLEERLRLITHPWHEDSYDLPAGKRLQILLLGDLLNRHTPIPRAEFAEQHHPLLSQPLLELCLRIPTYSLLRRGRQRGLAREAFKDYLPKEIVERESKGSTTSYFMGLFRQGLPFVRELLLDGICVQQGLLDRTLLESYLVGSRPVRAEEVFPVFACVAAELWVRRWTVPDKRAIAAA